MILPLQITRPIWHRPLHPEVPKLRWWATVGQRLKHWMLEPVEFPGKWPAQEPLRERYNSECLSAPGKPYEH